MELYDSKTSELQALITQTHELNKKTQLQYDKFQLKLSFLQRILSECD